MTKFVIEIYDASTGANMELAWNNENEYQSTRALLKKLGCVSIVRSGPDSPEYYLLDTAEQREALFLFRRKLGKPSE